MRTRLLWVASLVLIVFTATALAVLDSAFRNTTEASLRDSIQAQIYALLTVVEPSPEGELNFIETLAEPRFGVANSGLYAYIYNADQLRVWSSVSALETDPPAAVPLPTGVQRFERESNQTGNDFYVMRFGVAWDLGPGLKPGYTFVVMESAARVDQRLNEFRRDLFAWSAVGTVMLLALQLLSLTWALTPLRRVSTEISRIEQGRQDQIVGNYPREISGLTNSLNGLILSSRRALERYRNSLGDLAHSLKTPLAVIRGAVGDDQPVVELRKNVDDQVTRMLSIVDYQLRRAASSGGAVLITPLALGPVAEKLVQALKKIHRQRNPEVHLDISPDLSVAMDEGDLMEVLGNLLENAFKWCDGKIQLSAVAEDRKIRLICQDDGPGIPDHEAEKIFNRGVRADEQVPGQGIGLAVVKEVVSSYAGDLVVKRGAWGGAHFEVTLPSG